MAVHAFTTTPYTGSALRNTRRSTAPQQRNVAAAGVSKKVNTLDENCKKVQGSSEKDTSRFSDLMNAWKALRAVDETRSLNTTWTYDQGFFTSGYFLEDVEVESPNILKTAERKKILSNIESLGLLSAAEKAGLSLSKVPGLARHT